MSEGIPNDKSPFFWYMINNLIQISILEYEWII